MLAELEEPVAVARQADRRRRRRQRPRHRHRRSTSADANPTADPIAVASRMVRVASAAALQHLDPREQAVIALLASTPGIDRHLLDKLAGRGLRRPRRRRRHPAAAAGHRRARPRRGVGLPGRSRRSADGRRAGRRAARTRPAARGRRPPARRRRSRAGDADGDGAQRVDHRHRRAAPDAQPAGPPRPDHRSRAGPPVAAGVGHPLARTGRRGRRRHRPGRRHRRRRRRRRCAGASPSSRRGPAWPRVATRRPCASPSETLAELGDGESRTYARANEVLAECAAMSDAREDLQRAAESYQVAAAAWEGCGEFARARACRRYLALGVLAPLGRYDEALAQVGQLLGAPTCPTPSARGRSWSRGSCCSTPTGSTAPRAGSSASPTSATCTTTRA